MTANDDNTLIFVEVKYRKSTNFGTAQEMVSKSKQQKNHQYSKYLVKEKLSIPKLRIQI